MNSIFPKHFIFTHPNPWLGGICMLMALIGLVAFAKPAKGDEPKAKSALNRAEWLQMYADTPRLVLRDFRPFKTTFTPWISIFEVHEEAIGMESLYSASFHGGVICKDGSLRSFRINGLGMQGGGPGAASAELVKRLQPLVARLPDDGKRFPPDGRRLVVRVEDELRLYDRGNIPESVLELIRTLKLRIENWTPDFSPMRKLHSHGAESQGVFALSPDLKHLVAGDWHGPLRIRNAKTLEWERDVDLHGRISPTGLAFSPNGRFAVVQDWPACHVFDTKTWKKLHSFEEPQVGNFWPSLSDAQFTPDGRFLMLRCSKSTLRFFRTSSWAAIERVPDVPAQVVAFVPAPKARRAVLESLGNRVVLWDTENAREVRVLSENSRLERVAFSPDETKVAVATVEQADGGYWTNCRLRVWSAKDGSLTSELHTYEYDSCETIRRVLWTADSRYVIAPVKGRLYAPPIIKIWNSVTGRHRGSLVGTNGEQLFGAEILAGEKRLAASGHDGNIYVWDLAEALRVTREFEASVESEAEQR